MSGRLKLEIYNVTALNISMSRSDFSELIVSKVDLSEVKKPSVINVVSKRYLSHVTIIAPRYDTHLTE
jgi:hypothetical protein